MEFDWNIGIARNMQNTIDSIRTHHSSKVNEFRYLTHTKPPPSVELAATKQSRQTRDVHLCSFQTFTIFHCNVCLFVRFCCVVPESNAWRCHISHMHFAALPTAHT